MYLQQVIHEDGKHYRLRQSYRDHDTWKYRDLADLGSDPARFISYPGRSTFYFTSELETLLRLAGVQYSFQELVEVLAPFVHPGMRWAYGTPGENRFPYNLSMACEPEDLPRYQEELHPFDVRRLHFLKFGHIHMARVDSNRHYRFLKVLSCKCRDEIEAVFDAMERRLPGKEVSNYVYTAFHLQRHFPNHLLKNNPIGLDPEEVDAAFLQEICRLNEDGRFFRGVDQRDGGSLHPYLTRYAWLYFDHEFQEERYAPWEWHARSFFGEHQRPGDAPAIRNVDMKEACLVFDISREDLTAMSRRDIIRIFRGKAKKMHPDKGGDNDAFVRLIDAYEVLRSAKQH